MGKALPLVTVLAFTVLSCTPFARKPPPSSKPLPPRLGATQTGLASWYGLEEHGRKTASGQRFDRFKRTAAHRTLPLGTVVRVTNLENGRDVLVTINDRGPFVPGRIIDLSYAAAKEIGMIEQGVAKVKVEVLSVPRAYADPFTPSFTVQVGAFINRGSAVRLRDELGAKVGQDARVEVYRKGSRTFYRVRVGRFTKRREAERLARRLRAEGYRTRVVQE